MYMLPYVGAIDAFLAIWHSIPGPVRDFVFANFFFFSIVAILRGNR